MGWLKVAYHVREARTWDGLRLLAMLGSLEHGMVKGCLHVKELEHGLV